jgi:NTP pyrophosphatase (non-canonical NTP hydrolase)
VTQNIVLPPDIGEERAVGFLAYQRAIRLTDHLPPEEFETPILGFFGEVGSLLTVVKKQRRDAPAYPGYAAAILEEFGDVLWYFTALVDRAGLDLSIVAQRVFRDLSDWDVVGEDEFGTWGDIQRAQDPVPHEELSRRFAVVAGLAGELVSAFQAGKFKANRDRLSGELVAILAALIAAAEAADVDLDRAARTNLEKVFSRYPLDPTYPPLFDAQMPAHEQLPRQFEIRIEEHSADGRIWVTQTINDFTLGDPLTDNKGEADDYRFHDVFHLAYAVHLGWSPILRRLLKLKRKSDPRIDENEDGARAAIIEEGIATFIFGRALERNLFDGLDRLDFDLLKLAHSFVRGFEAERCAYWQWERAILDGFRMFRALKKHRSGIIKADLSSHTLAFFSL